MDCDAIMSGLLLIPAPVNLYDRTSNWFLVHFLISFTYNISDYYDQGYLGHADIKSYPGKQNYWECWCFLSPSVPLSLAGNLNPVPGEVGEESKRS